jgi:16S rRNA (guanine1207-N2)-methyltransferase
VLFRPPVGLRLPGVAPERLRVVHGFAPAHAAWLQAGVATSVEPPEAAAAAIVVLPRAKALAQDMIARALRYGGPVIVDGQKTEGVDSLLKALRARVSVSAPFAKAHGKCFALEGPADALEDWILPRLARTGSGWWTAPGAFSADGPDPGSVALGTALPAHLSGRVADLGAGWGYLAAQALARPKVTEVALVEAEHAALEAARANIEDPRARFHWADATTWAAEAPFDHVVMNPPFHAGRAADPALGAAFIAAAARALAPHGTLWLVANRHLPYEAPLSGAFGQVEPLAEAGAYKLARATRPVRVRGRGGRHGKARSPR